MAIDQYNHFVAIVAGDNPEVLMSPYDKNIKTEPSVVYRFKDAPKIREQFITMYEAILKKAKENDDKFLIKDAEENLNDIKASSPTEFYYTLTEDYEYDKETGDALTRENPLGRWATYRLGKFFSIPFITLDGKEVFQAKKGEIDWSLMHLANSEVYKRTWEMIMENSEPTNESEKKIYDAMKLKTTYFEKFGNKENYILVNTAFWGYAFVSKNGWLELEEDMDQFAWVKNYYEKFIDPLPDDTLLTIYECTK